MAVGPEHVFVSSAFEAVLAVVAEAAQNAAQGLRAGTEPGAAAVVFKADDGAELRLKGEIADHALLRTLRREVEDVQAGAACPCGGVIVVAHELVAAADAEKDRPVLRGGADIRALASAQVLQQQALFKVLTAAYEKEVEAAELPPFPYGQLGDGAAYAAPLEALLMQRTLPRSP